MILRIIHYRAKCIGCHGCVTIAPDRWRMSKKDGKSVLLGAKEKKGVWTAALDEDEYERNLNAAKLCPARIIQVNRY